MVLRSKRGSREGAFRLNRRAPADDGTYGKAAPNELSISTCLDLTFRHAGLAGKTRGRIELGTGSAAVKRS